MTTDSLNIDLLSMGSLHDNGNQTPTIKSIGQIVYDLPTHWINDWLLHIIQRPQSFFITDSDYQLSATQYAQFNTGIEKMRAGIPLAYLVGKQEFWSLEFLVNEHTLIPRPDTEVLVEKVLEWIEQHHNREDNSLSESKSTTKNLLDLGTGSGCIAISLAHELNKSHINKNQLCKWQVTAVDYSEQALDVAKKNAQLNNIANIDFVKSDWFSALPKGIKYQVIISNPPYIDATDTHLKTLNAEPISALVANNKGLADIECIVSGATDYLAKGGLLAIEHGYDQKIAVQHLFKQAGFRTVKTIKDYGNNERVTLGYSL